MVRGFCSDIAERGGDERQPTELHNQLMRGQDLETLRANIVAYRSAWQPHDRPGPHGVCMAHVPGARPRVDP
jgi:hypothetical protein